MKILLWLILISVGLAVLHHGALWAERRGWIFYKYRKASPRGVGNAFLEVQSLLEPGARHVTETRIQEAAEEDESGDPPCRENDGDDRASDEDEVQRGKR